MIYYVVCAIMGWLLGLAMTNLCKPNSKTLESEKNSFPDDFDPLKILKENEFLKEREGSLRQETKLLWARLKEETQLLELLEKAREEGDLDFIKHELKKRSLLKQKIVCVSGAYSVSGVRITDQW